MKNLWSNDYASEYDLLLEAQETEDLAEEQAYQPIAVDATDEEIEQILEESAFDLNNNEANIIYNTKIRLEQARLYDMLINHNLFDGVDADPNAIAIVQNELKHYIVKRLEILMGLRPPKAVEVESRFSNLNDIEIDFLKQLAYKGTHGRSAQAQREEEEIESNNNEMPTPRPPQSGLNSIKKTMKPMVARALPQQKKSNQQRPQQKKIPTPTAQQPPKKQKTSEPSYRDRLSKSAHSHRELTQSEAEILAKEELKSTKKKKPFEKMSAKEKKEEIMRVNKQYEKPSRPPGAVPMLTSDQLFQHCVTQQSLLKANQSDDPMSQIMGLVTQKYIQNNND